MTGAESRGTAASPTAPHEMIMTEAPNVHPSATQTPLARRTARRLFQYHDRRGPHAPASLHSGDRAMDEKHYKHGSMDTSEQEKTFAGFMKVTMIGATVSITVLIFIAIVNG
jgi:hypothetical protein